MAVTWGCVSTVSFLLLLLAAITAACVTLPVEKILKDFLLWIDQSLGSCGPFFFLVVVISLDCRLALLQILLELLLVPQRLSSLVEQLPNHMLFQSLRIVLSFRQLLLQFRDLGLRLLCFFGLFLYFRLTC